MPRFDPEKAQGHGEGFGSPGRPAEMIRFDPAEFRLRLSEAVQNAGSRDTSQTNGFYYVLWEKDGSLLARSAGAPLEVPSPVLLGSSESQLHSEPDSPGGPPHHGPGPPTPPIVRTRGELREHYRFMPHGECLLVGHSLPPELAAMHRLELWLTAAGSGILVLGLAGGWWLATRAIRPIEDISATAGKIAAGELSQRINAADTESELGRLAGVLNSTFARLEAAFAHQARFTSDASHELRTPVSVILSQTQTVLSRERGASEYREALEACQRAAQRMRTLTESLLELARLDAGQEPMKREPFDLSRVVRECVELVRPLADQRNIQILCDLSSVECLGDAERLSQVATNLLSNAIQFNRQGGEVRISACNDNGAALLTVTDTGEGIAAEHLPHLFERFYRADPSRSRNQGRTGLGLAICKAIVDAHGGTIEVASQPGAGTTFTVKLPLK
jgi:heavy metal sensor kinase